MKNKLLFLIPFVPSIFGYILNLTVLLPFGTILLFYISPIVTAVFWYKAGKIYAKAYTSPIKAKLIAHSVGILSIIIYIWQFMLTSDVNKNLALAWMCQMFFVPMSCVSENILWLFSSVYRLFFGVPTIHVWVTNIISLVLMLIIFYTGYRKEKS